MPLEEQDVEFEELLLEKRHKELLRALKSIVAIIGENKEVDLSPLLQKHEDAISKFVAAIKELPAPQVKIETDNKEIEVSIKKISEAILRSNEDLKKEVVKLQNKPKEKWEVKFERNSYTGLMQSPITLEQVK